MTEASITPLIERLVAAGCDVVTAALVVSQAYNVGFSAGAPKRSSAAIRCKRWREKTRVKRIENVSNDTPPTPVSQPSQVTRKRVASVSNDTVCNNINSTEVVSREEPILTSEPENLSFVGTGKSKITRGTRIDPRWRIMDGSDGWKFAIAAGLKPAEIGDQFEQFRDYWLAKTGSKALKSDWPAVWRSWVRNHLKFQQQRSAQLGMPKGFNADIDGPLLGAL